LFKKQVRDQLFNTKAKFRITNENEVKSHRKYKAETYRNDTKNKGKGEQEINYGIID